MRDPLSLLSALEAHPARFDFHAALRQLECAFAHLPRIGQAARPADEAVRFGQQPSLAFEPAMINSLIPGATPKLLLNFFGLLGANGPLPIHLSEYIRDRQRNLNDPTLAAFCDVFHHRMISLFYRAWASAQPAVSLDRPQADRFAQYLGSLIGIGMPSMLGRDTVPDVAKLHFAGRLGPQTRNAEGLAALLTDYLQVPVQVEQFVGHWMTLPADGLCALRSGPDAPVLGQTTVMGKKVWNTQHKFRLLIGPLDLEQTRRLLPGGDSLKRVQDWVRQYVGLAMDWDVNLIVKKEQLPGLRLGSAPLGWTSWLSSKAPLADDRQLLVNPRISHTSQGPAHG
ncbi:type VI secretion system baseplate subunit TssG [Pseudomonas sp. Bout1]|uniref:type VI secretion system baseplate subunit TssG n=1 Tax=Pseudomonas sp. Bout1 TaxID=3048600 RepID=UPI002AB3B102|nr:type VI secretion system baseplate subunit TssG [Pseudomonas sp. Bout1]MDY7532536.1 type VI secretion system baseplate subunit TssG [Pseudomonas sp. Bout1]MEB0188165.1 type VI secretion system baseplate subunit TssG [Pseudomonas sp. Bout1]